MSYQSILVHVDDGERVVVRLGAAARLARSFDAELIGAYVVPTVPLAPSVSAILPDSMVRERMREMGDAQSAAEALFRAAAARARVAAVEWRAPAGEAVATLVDHARCADLVIVGQRDPEDDQADFAGDVVNALVLQSGRPVLAIPYAGAPTTLGATVLVTWNGTRESARAVADAMPLLARAEKVYALTIFDKGDRAVAEGHAEQRLATWLRYHGIDALPRHYHVPDIDIGELILSQTSDLGVDLVVMGGYSHSRLQQLVLGGVTRHVLDTMTVPVLMSH
jgi:nucleotide-binding universal stress UspA family protein